MKPKKRETRKHGLSGHSSYQTWSTMVHRCRPHSNSSAWYSERGIGVCERWLEPENFISDMGEKPKGMTLERISNDKGYSPENCRWATQTEQHRNTRRNHYVCLGQDTRCLTEWAEVYGVHARTIAGRLKRGWGEYEAITTPAKRMGRAVTLAGGKPRV